MRYWLVKQEPSVYSFGDLERDGETEWNGVHNPTALLHLRAMRVGDLAIFYHSGDERAAVGVLEIVRSAQPDRSDPRPSWTVRVRAVRRLRSPVELAAIRSDPAFAGFDLLRISRLSVLPVSEAHWKRLMSLAEGAKVESYRPATAGARGRARTSGSRQRGSA